MRRLLLVLVTGVLVGAFLAPIVTVGAASDSDGSMYEPRSSQCVLFDTRKTAPLTAGVVRTFALSGDLTGQGGEAACAVSANATGFHLNLVAISPTGPGNLKAWPASESEPNGGIVNFLAANNSNAFMVGNDGQGLKVKANGSSVHTRGILYGELFDGPAAQIEALGTRVAALEALLEGVTRTAADKVVFPATVHALGDLAADGWVFADLNADGNGHVFSKGDLYANRNVWADLDDNGTGHLRSLGDVYANGGVVGDYDQDGVGELFSFGSIFAKGDVSAEGHVFADKQLVSAEGVTTDGNITAAGNLVTRGQLVADTGIWTGGAVLATTNVIADGSVFADFDQDGEGFLYSYGGVFAEGNVCAGNFAVCMQ